MKKIAAVIVTYNRKNKLINCINAVLGQAGSSPDIIIADNNSSDGTAELFGGSNAVFTDERIRYFNTGMNTGGAGGFTFGIRKAHELGYDYVWLMDDDCIPEPGALKVFTEYDEAHSGEYGFLSSKVLWRDGSLCRMNIQRETLTRNVRVWDRKEISIRMASFVSLFVPMTVIEEEGLPFRQFFMWSDDWEYTGRISRRRECLLLTESRVVHDMETNERADISAASDDRLGRFRYLYRNDVYLYRREGLAGLSYEAVRLPLHIARILFSGRSAAEKFIRAGIVISGTAEGLSFFPEPDRLAAKERK